MWIGDYERLYGGKNEPEKGGFFSTWKIVGIILFLVFLVARSCFEDTYQGLTKQNQNPVEQIQQQTEQYQNSMDPYKESIKSSRESKVTPNKVREAIRREAAQEKNE